MAMEVIKKPISRDQLKSIAHSQFGNLIKAVVDQEKIKKVIEKLIPE